jgi:hypothetical protein
MARFGRADPSGEGRLSLTSKAEAAGTSSNRRG